MDRPDVSSSRCIEEALQEIFPASVPPACTPMFGAGAESDEQRRTLASQAEQPRGQDGGADDRAGDPHWVAPGRPVDEDEPAVFRTSDRQRTETTIE